MCVWNGWATPVSIDRPDVSQLTPAAGALLHTDVPIVAAVDGLRLVGGI